MQTNTTADERRHGKDLLFAWDEYGNEPSGFTPRCQLAFFCRDDPIFIASDISSPQLAAILFILIANSTI
jgi:hypothetical protein